MKKKPETAPPPAPAAPPSAPPVVPMEQQIAILNEWLAAVVDVVGAGQVVARLQERQKARVEAAKKPPVG